MINSMNILVTGAAGFIGSCFVRLLAKRDESTRVTTLDALTYCSSMDSLDELKNNPRHQFIEANICDRKKVEQIFANNSFDAVVNFAAESHVDRSITDPEEFVFTNVIGTHVLLDCARKQGVSKFVQISTDEVYGSLGKEGVFHKEDPLNPSSPYSASKASADLLCLSYHKTYEFPVVITRSVNAYGPFQYPEKLIPVLIKKAKNNQNLPIYGDGMNVRSWIYVEDNCEAIRLILNEGKPGSVYHITSGEECSNLDVAKEVIKIMGKNENLIEFVKDRPGHDWRYALESIDLNKDFGWSPKVSFQEGLQKTIDWYEANQNWVEKILERGNSFS